VGELTLEKPFSSRLEIHHPNVDSRKLRDSHVRPLSGPGRFCARGIADTGMVSTRRRRNAREGVRFGVQGAGCRVQGAGCRVQGAGFRVLSGETYFSFI